VGVVATLIAAVLSVGWVPEDGVILPAALLGLLLGVVLARRPLKTWIAWTFIVIYGFLITTLTLGNLWPPLYLLLSDWAALRIYWLENGALFLDRLGIWFTAVFSGGRSNETIVFAYLMGLAAWFLAAYVGWSAFRQRRPLLGLTLMGLIVAINGYYGQAAIETALAFVGMALLATAVLHFANLEWVWQRHAVDYSREIRLEMLAYATGIGVALLALSFLLPSFNPTRLAQAILGQPAVAEVEAFLDRAFGGVAPPRGQQIPPGQAGGAGIMPRSFLLGNAPELEKIIVMTAATELVQGPQSATLNLARHWRALSYEIYTGRGWALSDERAEFFDVYEPIPLPPAESQMLIEQSVNWRYDNRISRYTLGLPLSYSQPVKTYWRGETDFVRAVTEEGPRYEAVSRVTAATPEELRQASLDDVPSSISARYTQLPDDLPARIHELAAEVTAEAPTPYDQARAIERFLRQYNYSLEVELPPPDVDPVDYFLFELQEGYCDYYASSMVVMARNLGLPARIATGFLAQPAEEDGMQTVRQINAHSWAEVYFAGYGWVEFEPTAQFISPHDPPAEWEETERYQEFESSPEETAPIPEKEPQSSFSWSSLLLVYIALLAGAGLLFWLMRRRGKSGGDVEWAYGRLQRNARHLGHPLPASQTPNEFSDELLHRIDKLGDYPRLARLVKSVRAPIKQLTGLFVKQRYSGEPVRSSWTAVSLWRQLRRPMWLLRLGKRFVRDDDPDRSL
jgi:transglutaminase-like putative cysteine protease